MVTLLFFINMLYYVFIMPLGKNKSMKKIKTLICSWIVASLCITAMPTMAIESPTMTHMSMVDTNQNGELSLFEVSDAYARVRGLYGTVQLCDNSQPLLCANFNTSNNNTFINFSDLATLTQFVKQEAPIEYRRLVAITYFDTNQNGYLSTSELIAGYEMISSVYGTEEKDIRFIAGADVNANGFINHDDFGELRILSELVRDNSPVPVSFNDYVLANPLPGVSASPVSLTYNGKFVEGSENLGSVLTANSKVLVNIIGDTFISPGGLLVEGQHFTLTNKPAGLTALMRVSADAKTLRLTFGGFAVSHNNANDVSNLTLSFLDAAFVNSKAANVANSTNNKLEIDFIDNTPSTSLSYNGSFIEHPSNDGSMTGSQILIDITGDSFVNAGGTLALGTHYYVNNVPVGLTAYMRVSADGKRLRLTLEGKAATHASATDVSNLSITFTDSAFVSSRSSEVANNSYNQGLVRFIDPEFAVLSSSGSFVEYATNDGSLVGSQLLVDVVGDSFVNRAGVLVEGTHFTLANKPEGLTALMRVSADSKRVRLTFTGQALNHTNANDSVLVVSFLDGAFEKTPISKASNYSVSTKIDFNGALSGLQILPINEQKIVAGDLMIVPVKIIGATANKKISVKLNAETVGATRKMSIYPLGDLSQNGEVSAFDAGLLLQSIEGKRLLSPRELALANADRDSNGQVNNNDVSKIMAISTSKEVGENYVILWSSDMADVGARSVGVEAMEIGDVRNTDYKAFNIFAEAPVVTNAMDLRVTEMAVSRNAGAKTGAPQTMRVVVENKGKANSGPFTLALTTTGEGVEYVDQPQKITVPNLSAGQKRNYDFKWVVPAVGGYNVRLAVDSDNAVREINEDNNSAELGVVVTTAGSGAVGVVAPTEGSLLLPGSVLNVKLAEYGLFKRGFDYEVKLLADNYAFGPFVVKTKSNNFSLQLPTDMQAANNYQLKITPCTGDNCGVGNDYYTNVMSGATYRVMQTPKVLGETDSDTDDEQMFVVPVASPFWSEKAKELVAKERLMSTKTKLSRNLAGKILLQVEAGGSLWYVDHLGKYRYLLDAGSAIDMLRMFATKISSDDIALIPVGVTKKVTALDEDGDGVTNELETVLGMNLNNKDSDNDGRADRVEIVAMSNPLGAGRIKTDRKVVAQYSGQFIIDSATETLWYVAPKEGRRYLLTTDGGYNVIKAIAVGVKNKALRDVAVGE